jgi:hypothetical protein
MAVGVCVEDSRREYGGIWDMNGSVSRVGRPGLSFRVHGPSVLVRRGSWLVRRGSWLVPRGSWLVALAPWLANRLWCFARCASFLIPLSSFLARRSSWSGFLSRGSWLGACGRGPVAQCSRLGGDGPASRVRCGVFSVHCSVFCVLCSVFPRRFSRRGSLGLLSGPTARFDGWGLVKVGGS